jgi:hypothetical protein
VNVLSFPFLVPLREKMNLVLFATVVLTLLLVFWLAKRSSADPYGQFHLALNKLPDDKPGALPRTEWLNMGYWKVPSIFLLSPSSVDRAHASQ